MRSIGREYRGGYTREELRGMKSREIPKRKDPETEAKWLLIKAVPIRGGFILKAENGELPCEGCTFNSRIDAYDACRAMYPSNGVWKGEKVRGGYRIKID